MWGAFLLPFVLSACGAATGLSDELLPADAGAEHSNGDSSANEGSVDGPSETADAGPLTCSYRAEGSTGISEVTCTGLGVACIPVLGCVQNHHIDTTAPLCAGIPCEGECFASIAECDATGG